MDTRGQSIGIARYFLALIVGAIMIWIVNEVTSPILSGAENSTTNATANQATMWMQDIIGYLPIAFLILGFFSLVVYSVFVREAIGR